MHRENFLPILIAMAHTILVGAQWADEGKGKIIDVLTARLISLFEARRQ